MDDDDLTWTLIAGAVTLGAAAVAKKLLAKGWAKRRGALPGTPGDGRTSWAEAAVFALASGAAVGLARLVAERGLAAARPSGPAPATATS